MITSAVLVEDHPAVRVGIRVTLAGAGIRVVAETGNTETARRLVAVHRPGLVVLDLGLGAKSGIEILPELASHSRVLVCSMHLELLHEAFSRGARGFLSKKAAAPELVTAARAVLTGRQYVEPALAARMAAPSSGRSLSKREWQVLRLLAEGYTNQQVADRLSVSLRTIESVRAGLRNRHGLGTRVELVEFLKRTSIGVG